MAPTTTEHDAGLEMDRVSLSNLSEKNRKDPPTPDRDKPITRLRRVDSLDMESNRVSGMAHHGHKLLSTSLILRLAYQSIGVVYGDIGTSPLYVYSNTFPKGLDTPHYKMDILGALCLIIYSITLIPLIKYVFIVLLATDNGDGGTFALYSLICRHARVSTIPNQQLEDREVSSYKLDLPSKQMSRAYKVKEIIEKSPALKTILLLVALVGTSMVIGDGVLTPCISVLSAVGGIQSAAPSKLHQSSVVGISIVILIALFMVQRFGTSKVGFIFAPAVITWFSFIAIIGLYNIFHYEPSIFKAFNPVYMYDYFKRNKTEGWKSLGGVVLAITGTEAMFADVGHFSVRSIQIAFSFVVYPCLLLAYMGQASYLMVHPEDVLNVFYASVPGPVYWPMFVVAVAAAIIASQAMISATFTIVKQSMALGCFPRVKVVHTSSRVAGQVYIPELNWILMIACVCVTAAFKTTEKLGNAYGIAVVGVMAVTTSLLFLIMIMIWQTHLSLALAFLGVFGSVELFYFSSVLSKFDQGGYLPLAFAAVLLFIMYVWHYVSVRRYNYEIQNKISADYLIQLVPKATRVPGLGLVYTELAQGIPSIFSHMVQNLPAIHSVVVFVCVKFLPVPTVIEEERFLMRRVGPRNYHIYRCVARYGYGDVRQETDDFELHLLQELSYFIGREVYEAGVVRFGNQDNILPDHGEEKTETQTDASAQTATEMLSKEGDSTPTQAARISNGSIKSEKLNDNSYRHSDRFGGRISTGSIKSDKPSDVGSEMQLVKEVEEELNFLNESKDAGVVYLLGHSDVRASSTSSILRRFIIDYAYDALRRNCRKGSDALIVPHQKMLELGMIYNI